MKTKVRTFLALLFGFTTGGSLLLAASNFSVQSGGISIGTQNTATAGTSVAPWTVNEIITAAGTLALTDTDGTPLQSPTGVPNYTSGSWITKTVLNNSGVLWTSFEIELQQILGTPSPEGDGLSFAQGAGLTFTSSVFTTITRADITRDYLNFSGGSVANGASVSFTFAVTDNTPQSPVYISQTPNRAEIGVPDAGSTGLLFLLGLAGLLSLKRKLR